MMITLLVLEGCRNSRSDTRVVTSPQERLINMLNKLPTVKSVEEWSLPDFITDRDGTPLKISTSHYDVYNTLDDPLILRQVPVFLESAFRSYSEVMGHSITVPEKLAVYFFKTRSQWEDFTRHWTGPMADNYLKIQSGAYYLNGACIAYNLTRQSSFSVLAHEGWHQFSDELFTYRLPAWLDEGLATNFEAYHWENGRVIFDANTNGSRLFSLRQTYAADALFNISDLLTLDAGRVISHTTFNVDGTQSNTRVIAYYAQLYALVRFLREYEYGIYREKFQQMLDDAYLGRWPLDDSLISEATQRDRNPTRRWNAIVGQLIFQTYIASSPLEIESQYRAFSNKIQAKALFKKKL
ncbi:MAG: hypothetical protein JW860_03280 [Sedimentisphaerales bacterium]|nr:hypothetical protein [Sedimentisphaerales bacterium]